MKELTILCCAMLICTLTVQLSAQTQWTKDPANPASLNGNPGTWNQNVFSPFVIYNEDSTRYEMWFSAFGTSYQIGYAISHDGSNWTMPLSTPVLTATPGAWDGVAVFSPMVIREGGLYKMWYGGGTNDFHNRIGYATSPDGINWTKYAGNPVLTPQAPWEADAVGNHYVMHTGGGYQMWYMGGLNEAITTGAIGYATSTDGITWLKDSVHNPVLVKGSSGAWDGRLVWAPRVLNLSGTYFMWYSGMDASTYRKIGLATSADGGITWTKYANNPVLIPTPGSWEVPSVQDGFVMLRGSALHMWYAGLTVSANRSRIGHATSHDRVHLVPQVYPTIQAAIDASVNGDTVLVSDSTYYENIRFRGKRITVASTYLTTGDTSHIANTIIDGSQPTHPDSGSVVYFINGEDTTSVLRGFTIRGGSGTREYWYGYWWRFGGGIFCRNSGGCIADNIITRNRLSHDGVAGGGVMATSDLMVLPYLILERNKVVDNYIYELNVGGSGGAGAILDGVAGRVVGNTFERDTINALQANGGGLIIQALYPGYPNPLPSALVRGNVFRANVAQGRGSYGAVGAGALVYMTADVTISENLFENNIGTSESGWANGGGLSVCDNTTGYGRKMIVKNRFLNNRLSRGGSDAQCGGGVHLWYTLATLDGNEIADNSANGTGGGIAAFRSSFRIQNNIITRNSTGFHGGGLDIVDPPQSGTEQLVVNNTIFDNHASSYAGGLMVRGSANVASLNNIFWADTASANNEIYVDTWATASVHYCDVQGGWPSGIGNINADPRFVGSTFALSDSSQCLCHGFDSVQIAGVWYRAPNSCMNGIPRPSPAGSRPDIGACENPFFNPALCLSGVEEIEDGLPVAYALEQNYPNPFNPSTTISYQLPTQSHVTLKIFDVLGREVATLVNDVKSPGTYTVQWDATDLPSGVYFYRLQAGPFGESKKLLLLK